MKSYAEYLSLLAQETDADLTERDFALLTGAMLDAGVPDMELGALLGIFKARLDRVPLLLGLVDALDARIARWSTSGQCSPVSLACYGGTSDTADLTPLLGLMLARFGIPVLIHGPLHAASGVSVALVLRELGVLPCASREAVTRELQQKSLAFVPDALLAPGLANLLSFRARLGTLPLLVSAARLIDPFDAGALVVAAGECGPEMERLKTVIAVRGLRALLLQGTHGEPFASPDVRPRMEYWHHGASAVLFEKDVALARRSLMLPAASDVKAVASWIRQALEGARAIPSPLVNQLAACLYATGYCDDFNQAKALAVIAAAGRRVA